MSSTDKHKDTYGKGTGMVRKGQRKEWRWAEKDQNTDKNGSVWKKIRSKDTERK